MNHSDFLTAPGWAVINSLWQFALLWAIYQLIIAFRPGISAATRSAIASGMVIAGFAWFVFTFISFFKENIAEAVPYLYGPAGWNHWIADALPATSVIYLLLLTIPLFRFIRNYRYVQIIRTTALHKADVQLRLYVQKLSAQMGIGKKVELWVSDLVNSPVTIGYLRPVILLPVAAINHLSTQQVEAIILHELAHIRRFDYLLNLVTKFIQSVLYFNPFVKAFVRIIETEREKSCDEMVMQFQYDAHGYASALLTIEQINSVKHQVLTVAASGTRKHQLLGRIENILGINRNKGITAMRVAGIMLALSCMAIMHIVLQWKKPAVIGTDNYLSPTSLHLICSITIVEIHRQ
ncbi:MAG: M56 family metallopeptidase [Chitinophagaceae bacterium]|nr:M56 family metallopeptidase [Chitinophagaceae bacterium]